MRLRSPGPENRIAILGSTGTGKTTAGVFHLSRANFDEMPWTIIDSKRDKEIGALIAPQIDYGTPPPELPGLYVFRVRPGSSEDRSALEDYLTQVHERGNHGVFVDEGYSVYPVRQRGALTDILTQGRSLRIPVIFNSQRPSGVGVEALSEATFFQVFDLTRPMDRKVAQEWLPDVDIMSEQIGQYKSIYRDEPLKVSTKLKPVRPAEQSVAVINARLGEMYRQREEVRQLVASEERPVKVRLRAI